jgi:hypothetical protein
MACDKPIIHKHLMTGAKSLANPEESIYKAVIGSRRRMKASKNQ